MKDRDCLDLPPDMKEILIKLTASDKEKYKSDYLKNFSNITTQLDATLSLARMCCSSVQELVSHLRPPTRNVEAAMNTVSFDDDCACDCDSCSYSFHSSMNEPYFI